MEVLTVTSRLLTVIIGSEVPAVISMVRNFPLDFLCSFGICDHFTLSFCFRQEFLIITKFNTNLRGVDCAFPSQASLADHRPFHAAVYIVVLCLCCHLAFPHKSHCTLCSLNSEPCLNMRLSLFTAFSFQ